MKTILEKVKADFIKYDHSGLCVVAWLYLNCVEERKFKDYLYKHRPRKLYWQLDFKTRKWFQSKKKHGAYYWKPSTKKARIKWLDKHIKLNS